MCRHTDFLFEEKVSCMKKMKLIAIVTGVAMAFGSVAPCVALANDRPDEEPTPAIETYANTADSNFSFTMNFKGATSATGYRPKDNSSSVYVYVTKCSGRPRLYVDGAKDANGTGKQDCTATTYHATKVGQFRMRNYVNGRGFKRARLTAWAENGAAVVRGVWSPDSKYSYVEMPH